MKQVVIDASNLHVGGGVQVAGAFVGDVLELQRTAEYIFPWMKPMRFALSDEVLNSLPGPLRDDVNLTGFSDGESSQIPDLRFIIFGPRYRRLAAKRTLAGFADVTSVYPNPLPQSIRARATTTLRNKLSHRFFRSVDHIVVETAAVRDRLAALGLNLSNITVVPNTYHPVFDGWVETQNAQPFRQPPGVTPQVLYVARAYPHKNHDFLGEVAKAYESLTGDRILLTVTLTKVEWDSRTQLFREFAKNVGAVDVRDLPPLYKSSDLVIFPSLLECFSATPLEAMAMGRPLVASDRDYVRTICGDSAAYFDPFDPESAANAIWSVIHDHKYRNTLLSSAAETIRSWPRSAQRTVSYLDLIDRILRT